MFSFNPKCIPHARPFRTNFDIACKIFRARKCRTRLLRINYENGDTVVTRDELAGYTLSELSMYWLRSHLDGLQLGEHVDDVS